MERSRLFRTVPFFCACISRSIFHIPFDYIHNLPTHPTFFSSNIIHYICIMKYKNRNRLYRIPDWEQNPTQSTTQRLPLNKGQKLVHAFVEGYEDVAFWRGILDDFESDRLTFEVSVPVRDDLAKGKKVLLNMLPRSSEELIMCADSDFDYIFGQSTPQSRVVNDSRFLFHTYTYATENYLCYAPSLHNVCAKATKNDTRIFDFEEFMTEYSKIIYPLFLWYAYSARQDSQNMLTLADFKSSVKLNYLEVEGGGRETLSWLRRQVGRRLQSIESRYGEHKSAVESFGRDLQSYDLFPDNTYLYMHGHTLMDNVVMIMLGAVCDKLRLMTTAMISSSARQGVALNNEISNYRNSLRSVRDVLLDNQDYKNCFLYRRLKDDLQRYVSSISR